MVGRFTKSRVFADPEKAARRLLEHAGAFEPAPHGRIDIEQLRHPFLFGDKATPTEYSAGLDRAILNGWLELDESGAFVLVTPGGGTLREEAKLSEPGSRDDRP
jgi:hypothetical protein